MNGSASPEPANTPSPQLASLTARLTAKLIDLTITAAIAFIGLAWFEFVRNWSPNMDPLARYTDREAYLSVTPLLAVVVYELAMITATAWKGKTPGKKLLKIQVTSNDSSRPPIALRAIARWALPLAPTAPLIDGFIRDIPELANNEHAAALSGRVWWLWVAVGWWLLVHASALWDSQRRGWHDKAAGTIVIKTPRPHRSGQGPEIPKKWQGWRDVPFS